MLSNTNRQMIKNILDIVAEDTEDKNLGLSIMYDCVGLKMSDNIYEYDTKRCTIIKKLDKAYKKQNTNR